MAPFLADLLGGGGGGARTVVRTSESGSGVSDHGALTGLGDDDHSQYLRVDGARALTGNLNLADHDITNVRYINGLLLDDFVDDFQQMESDIDALQSRTVLAGDGIDSDGVTFGAGSPTVSVDVSDFAGAGLMDDGNNNLSIRVGDGLELDGLYLAVDEDFDFAWTGDHTHTGILSSLPFDSADPITGWKIAADGDAWFANIEATSLTIKTFVSDVTLALQGSEIIAKSKAILSRDFSTPATTGTLYVYDLPGQPDTAVFETGDFVRLRYVNRATGLSVGDVWGTVSSYTDLDDGEQSWTFSRKAGNSGQTIYSGMVAIDYGQSGDGYITLTSLGDDAPYIDVRTWTTTPAVAGNHTTVARVGTLDGITDADLGPLTGDGIYTLAGHFKGELSAAGGDVWIAEEGLNIQAGTGSSGGWSNYTDKITFSTEPGEAQAADLVVAQLGARKYDTGTEVYNVFELRADAGSSQLTDLAQATVGAFYNSTDYAQVARWVDNSEAVVSITAYKASGGSRINLSADTTYVFGDIAISGGGNIGTALAPVGTLYADELVILGEVNYDNPGMVNDTRYYPRSELDTYLAATYSPIGHSHAGLVTSATLASTLADYVDDAALALALADYDTSAEVDTKIAGLSADTHTHNLADLAERNYGSLQNRGHVLASTAGLGADHTVSGLTAGMVLRASSAAAAAFAVLDYADLGDTEHDINTEHSGNLAWSRVAKSGSDLADLETRKYTDLTNRAHNVVSEHSVTAAQYSVLGTWAGADTLGMETAGSDGTVAHTLLMSGDNGELSLQQIDGGGNTLLVGDTLRSASYASSLGDSGWELGEAGQNLSNVFISGSLASTLIEYKSRIVGGGGQIWRPAGKLKTDLTIDDKPYRPDGAFGGVPGVFPEYTIHMENPALGKIQIADVDDVLLIQALARNVPQTQTSNSANWGRDYWRIKYGYTDAGLLSKRSRFVVTAVTDEGDYYSYDVKLVEGGGNYTYPAGTGVVVDGGGVQVVADEPHAPYLDVYRLVNDTDPFADYEQHLYRHETIVRLGLLSGLAEGSAGEYGLLIRGGQEVESNGFTVDTGAYFKGNASGVELVNGNVIMRPSDYFWGDGTELTLDSINGLRFTIGELVNDEIGNDAMSIDWYHADDDPEADPYLLRIDANPSGDRAIHARGRTTTFESPSDEDENATLDITQTRSTLTISSQTDNDDYWTGNNARRTASLELEAFHQRVLVSGGNYDGDVALEKYSRATLSADQILFSNPYSGYTQYGWNIYSSMALRDGLIFLYGLPDSATGLPANALYVDDDGTLKIVL